MIGLGIILIVDAPVMMAGPIFGPEKVSIVVTVPVAPYTMLNAATGAEAVLDLFGSMILCVVLIGVATLDD